MADDDIEKLLREIDAMNNAQRPAVGPPAPVAKASTPETEKSQGRGAWAGVGAVGGLVVGGAAGTVLWFLPYVSTVPTAIGAALGGAAVGLASRPPEWFSKRR